MKTERFTLDKDMWQAIAGGAGTVTLKVITGNAQLVVADAAPAADAPFMPVSPSDSMVTMKDVKAWVRGADTIVTVITV